MGDSVILTNVENIYRVLNKMHNELTVGDKSHSSLLDCINHLESLAQQIEEEVK